MANIINGTDTGSGGLITTGDSSDELQLQTAETARVTLTNTAVVVNEGGNDVDFRVEGDTDANLLFVDASADAIGVGTNTPGAKIEATASGAVVQILNRTTSDGDVLEFEKDGTTVGSIGTPFTGELYIEASGANSSGLLFTSGNSVQPRKNSAADDGNISIGTSGNRFKDLYLSGSVYLGGTTSANALDDYEEGTFTPTVSGSTSAGTGTYDQQIGVYTKIGNLVTLSVWVKWTAHTGTGNLRVTNFPFTSINVTSYRACGVLGVAENLTLLANNFVSGLIIEPNQTSAGIGQTPTGGGLTSVVAMDTSANLHYSITYQTA